MTDPQVPVPDPSAAIAPAAPPGPAAAQGPGTAARRRRRWPLVTLAAVVVVAALAAGLVAWAPWTQPPVLRPAGLAAGPATANSISFRWSPPATGPLPDKYLILTNGKAAGSVAGTVTSYRQAGLTPASAHQYRVVAVRGGKRSPQSALLTARTLTPPLSQARLQGSWDVYVKNIRGAPGSRNGTLVWAFRPACAAGACDVIVHVKEGKHTYKMTLTRTGALYQGQAAVNVVHCGTPGNTIPDPATLKYRVHATAAAGQGQEWAATSLTGTLVATLRYVSSGTFYCPASTFKATLTGTPA